MPVQAESSAGEPLRVTVWGEGRHEKQDTEVEKIYPDGMHGAIAAAITTHLGDSAQVRTATLDDPGQGLPPEVLDTTDVLTSGGGTSLTTRCRTRSWSGSRPGCSPGWDWWCSTPGHFSKIFTPADGHHLPLIWRNDGERELVWTVRRRIQSPRACPQPIVIEPQEMYGEHFDIPAPDELVFVSSFAGGEVFRCGCTFTRGRGKIFYFSPGDQELPRLLSSGRPPRGRERRRLGGARAR